MLRALVILALLAGLIFFQANRNACQWVGLKRMDSWIGCILQY